MTKKKEEAAADPIQENRAEYDHETGTYREPKVGDDPKVLGRHQVDARQDIELEEGQDPNGSIPRRADPFAHQRDKKAAEKEYKEEAKKDEQESDK